MKQMTYQDQNEDFYYWNSNENLKINSNRGLYIAINGNTGAGKSTLIRKINDILKKKEVNYICINERILHHPLLKLMFHYPKEYGYFMQLNFTLQRHILLYRWLSLGYTVIIERSHLDDKLFAYNFYKNGIFSESEYSAYCNLVENLYLKLPDPDIYVYLDIEPNISFERINIDEINGIRPKEFPNEVEKKKYIDDWYLIYNEHFRQLINSQETNNLFTKTEFIRWNSQYKSAELLDTIIEKICK